METKLSLLRRLTASRDHLDAAELASQVEALDCEPIAATEHGQTCRVAGRIRSVVYTPREHVPTLEAELFDGTNSLRLVWFGRRRIVGIEPGRRLIVRGRIGVHDGHPAIYNPWYELQPAPGAHG